jgi:hypothetical protein
MDDARSMRQVEGVGNLGRDLQYVTVGSLRRLDPFDDLQGGSHLALGGGQRDWRLKALPPAAGPHAVEDLQRRARFTPDVGQRDGLRSARRFGHPPRATADHDDDQENNRDASTRDDGDALPRVLIHVGVRTIMRLRNTRTTAFFQ